MNFYERVYEAVKRIPRGKAATYGMIAALCGSPRASRVVGAALHRNPDPEHIPCHRVVNRDGRLAEAFVFGGINVQRQLLESEGVTVGSDGRVDLKRFIWKV